MTSFNDGVRMTKEAASIDQQKKQFQRTGLDTVVEAIDDIFSIKTQKFAAYSQKPFSSHGDPRLSRVTTF